MSKSLSMEFKKFPHKCICCNEGIVNDVHDICLICGWEDDEVQNDNPDFSGGANKLSLNEHRTEFQILRETKKSYQWCEKLK